MSASIDWLSGELPPVPRDDSTPLFDEVTLRFAPVWPVVEPSEDGTVPSMPPVKPAGLVRRAVRRFRLARWTAGRVTWGLSSAVLFVGSGALWLVIR
jgi:hypothetical protein